MNQNELDEIRVAAENVRDYAPGIRDWRDVAIDLLDHIDEQKKKLAQANQYALDLQYQLTDAETLLEGGKDERL